MFWSSNLQAMEMSLRFRKQINGIPIRDSFDELGDAGACNKDQERF